MHPYVRSYPTSDPSAPVRRSSGGAKRASAPPRKSRKTPVVAPQLAEPDVAAESASGPTSDVVTDVADVTVAAPVEDPGMTGALPKEDVAQEGVSEAASEEVAKPAAGPVVTVDDFEEIFTRFQTPLINFVFRLVGNRE